MARSQARPEACCCVRAGLDFFRQNCGLQHPCASLGREALFGRETAELRGAAEEVEASLAKTSLLDSDLAASLDSASPRLTGRFRNDVHASLALSVRAPAGWSRSCLALPAALEIEVVFLLECKPAVVSEESGVERAAVSLSG